MDFFLKGPATRTIIRPWQLGSSWSKMEEELKSYDSDGVGRDHGRGGQDSQVGHVGQRVEERHDRQRDVDGSGEVPGS